MTSRNSWGVGDVMCGLRYTGAGAGVGAIDGAGGMSVEGSLGGGGRALLDPGLGSRGGWVKGLAIGAGEDSRKSPSGVSRPERSTLLP